MWMFSPPMACQSNFVNKFCARHVQYEQIKSASGCRLLAAYFGSHQQHSGLRKTRDAVIRNLEIIGEACNNVSKKHSSFATEHDHVPWSFAYEMRNALAHGYFTVDYAMVWQTIEFDLPHLKAQITELNGLFG